MKNNVIKKVFSILSLLLFICVIIQIFLAGISVFEDAKFWSFHVKFIHYFEFIPLVMLILSFFGGIPKSLQFICIGLVVMVIIQYITVKLSGTIPYIGGLHVVWAGIIFWRALQVCQGSIPFLKNKA